MNNVTTTSSSSPSVIVPIIWFSPSVVLFIGALIIKCLGLESTLTRLCLGLASDSPGRRSSAQDHGGASTQVQVVIQRDRLRAAAASSAQDHGGASTQVQVVIQRDRLRAAASSDPCAICLGDYEYGEVLRLLPACRHVFHRSCIDRWLAIHSTCPLCRHSTPAI